MKKFVSSFLVASFIFIISLFFLTPTFAQTSQKDIQSLISQLQQQIKALQEQVQKLQAEVSSTKTELEAVKTELKFTKTLSRGATGDEVRQLQEFLKENFPEIYTGPVTSYFGFLTESAVKKFQEKQGIESIGVVGPKTLSKLNELITEGAGKSDVVPPGLLTAPGIEKKTENSAVSNPSTGGAGQIAATSSIAAPIAFTPIQSKIPTGVCLVKDKYVDIPRFDIADSGNGFAKYAVNGVNTASGLQTACTQTIYNYLLQQYCKTNSNLAQRLVLPYDYRSIGDIQNLSCSSQGCDFVSCSSVASLAPIPIPAAATTSQAVTNIATTTLSTNSGQATTAAITASTSTTVSTSQTTATSTSQTTTSNTSQIAATTTTATAPTTPTTLSATPIISNVRAENIDSRGAQIKWTTDISADSAVLWDTSNSGSFGISSIGTCAGGSEYSAYVTDHCISLYYNGLSSNTTYYYKARSVGPTLDPSKSFAYSNVQQFTTLATAAATPATTTTTITTTATTDTTPPTITIVGPSVDSPGSGGTCKSHFGHAVDDNVGIAEIQYKVDGVTFYSKTFSCGPSCIPSYGSGSCLDFLSLSNGNHTFTIVAKDTSNNVTTKDVNFSLPVVVTDIISPVISSVRSKNLAAISQILNSLNGILAKLSQILK